MNINTISTATNTPWKTSWLNTYESLISKGDSPLKASKKATRITNTKSQKGELPTQMPKIIKTYSIITTHNFKNHRIGLNECIIKAISPAQAMRKHNLPRLTTTYETIRIIIKLTEENHDNH